jgi:hypothetical protein
MQNKLEMQYAAKRDAHVSEVQDLKQQLEMKGNEIRNLNSSIDSLKSVNEELKVLFTHFAYVYNFHLFLMRFWDVACICCYVCRH